jgi:chromosome segregation ATPase
MTQTTGTPSPGNSGDRLEQIEALLANVAKSHAASTQRLDRIEALQARTQEQIDSNAKAIQSWESRIEDGIAEAEEVTTSTTAELGQRIERDEDHYDEQIRRFDRLHEEHAQRFNNFKEVMTYVARTETNPLKAKIVRYSRQEELLTTLLPSKNTP